MRVKLTAVYRKSLILPGIYMESCLIICVTHDIIGNWMY